MPGLPFKKDLQMIPAETQKGVRERCVFIRKLMNRDIAEWRQLFRDAYKKHGHAAVAKAAAKTFFELSGRRDCPKPLILLLKRKMMPFGSGHSATVDQMRPVLKMLGFSDYYVNKMCTEVRETNPAYKVPGGDIVEQYGYSGVRGARMWMLEYHEIPQRKMTRHR